MPNSAASRNLAAPLAALTLGSAQWVRLRAFPGCRGPLDRGDDLVAPDGVGEVRHGMVPLSSLPSSTGCCSGAVSRASIRSGPLELIQRYLADRPNAQLTGIERLATAYV